MKPTYINQAAELLDIEPEEVPDNLIKLLANVENNCQKLGGKLCSRQIISLAVELYKRI